MGIGVPGVPGRLAVQHVGEGIKPGGGIATAQRLLMAVQIVQDQTLRAKPATHKLVLYVR